MIGRINGIKLYCCEDPSLIENYDKAIADNSQVWDCHHRLEIQEDKILTIQDLKRQGLYYHRPASELIFLTKVEHNKLHGLNKTEKHKKALSEKMKGEKNPMFGKNHSEEAKKKMLNNYTHFLGKHHTEEAKKKISNSKKGISKTAEHKRKLSESIKGKHKYNNGIINIYAYECPEGFYPGFIKKEA